MPYGLAAPPYSGLPEGAGKSLKDALYADVGSLVGGSTITVIAAVACYELTASSVPLIVSVATLVITAFRAVIAWRRSWRWRSWYDAAYLWSAVAYIMSVSALTFWAFRTSDDPFVLSITLTVSALNTISIALRWFAVASVVRTHLLASMPVVIIFLMRGGYFFVEAFIYVCVAGFVYTSAARLRKILLSEMTYRRQSETMASRFRFAIDNMSHGMCMIDSVLRILVSNAELAECFGLPGSRQLQGARFPALVRYARRRGAIGACDAERLMDSFAVTTRGDSVTRFESTGLNGRVFHMTLKRHLEDGWVLVVQDVTDQRRAREALDRAAWFDAMTQLPNRRSIEEKISEALRATRGLEQRTEVLFIDLDGFKQINDTLGHKFGDRVLAESARRLREAIGDAGQASRWGGDEFVVLRSGPDDTATLKFAQRLIRELSRPMWIEGAEVVVGASVGVATCAGGAIGMEALLQQADMALYTAKRESRGECRLFELSMSERAGERRLLELDLQAALAARTFELQYQPIVDIDNGEVVSFEALARWRHPTRGQVSPALFVPVMEDLNLMNAFGAWALQRACEDASRWPANVRVGVNVSTRQIETLVDSVRRALAATGLDPGRLELEITETAALTSGDKVSKALETVRALGVRIALDDFGTGYSSLSHLMSLPLDKVKIDRSFTQQLGKSRKADVLVSNIARLSSQLGMRVTFEGVETMDQLERARALGIAAEGQGWLFGKAATAADVERAFKSQAEQAVA